MRAPPLLQPLHVLLLLLLPLLRGLLLLLLLPSCLQLHLGLAPLRGWRQLRAQCPARQQRGVDHAAARGGRCCSGLHLAVVLRVRLRKGLRAHRRVCVTAAAHATQRAVGGGGGTADSHSAAPRCVCAVQGRVDASSLTCRRTPHLQHGHLLQGQLQLRHAARARRLRRDKQQRRRGRRRAPSLLLVLLQLVRCAAAAAAAARLDGRRRHQQRIQVGQILLRLRLLLLGLLDRRARLLCVCCCCCCCCCCCWRRRRARRWWCNVYAVRTPVPASARHPHPRALHQLGGRSPARRERLRLRLLLLPSLAASQQRLHLCCSSCCRCLHRAQWGRLLRAAPVACAATHTRCCCCACMDCVKLQPRPLCRRFVLIIALLLVILLQLLQPQPRPRPRHLLLLLAPGSCHDAVHRLDGAPERGRHDARQRPGRAALPQRSLHNGPQRRRRTLACPLLLLALLAGLRQPFNLRLLLLLLLLLWRACGWRRCCCSHCSAPRALLLLLLLLCRQEPRQAASSGTSGGWCAPRPSSSTHSAAARQCGDQGCRHQDVANLHAAARRCGADDRRDGAEAQHRRCHAASTQLRCCRWCMCWRCCCGQRQTRLWQHGWYARRCCWGRGRRSGVELLSLRPCLCDDVQRRCSCWCRQVHTARARHHAAAAVLLTALAAAIRDGSCWRSTRRRSFLAPARRGCSCGLVLAAAAACATLHWRRRSSQAQVCARRSGCGSASAVATMLAHRPALVADPAALEARRCARERHEVHLVELRPLVRLGALIVQQQLRGHHGYALLLQRGAALLWLRWRLRLWLWCWVRGLSGCRRADVCATCRACGRSRLAALLPA
jgi:hypothetical protein